MYLLERCVQFHKLINNQNQTKLSLAVSKSVPELSDSNPEHTNAFYFADSCKAGDSDNTRDRDRIPINVRSHDNILLQRNRSKSSATRSDNFSDTILHLKPSTSTASSNSKMNGLLETYRQV